MPLKNNKTNKPIKKSKVANKLMNENITCPSNLSLLLYIANRGPHFLLPNRSLALLSDIQLPIRYQIDILSWATRQA